MKQEIEIKLEIAEGKLENLLNCAFFIDKEAQMQTLKLGNIYYDTDDLALNARKIALRIRNNNGVFIQTLKTQGSSDKGLHKRLEWEWQLDSNQLDGSLLPKESWPSDVDVATLSAKFSTNFNRKVCRFNHLSKQGNISCVEMALDIGSIEVPGSSKKQPINELELELVEGCEDAVQEVADILIEQCPYLTPSNISKALRGYNSLADSKNNAIKGSD